ncbi:hypothetical protein M427DRAFT_61692 [Gonapodya prolifera JEL478]|uniref:Uncharacterized protein n=1 Tax=Gonapodya prolifera (strain JEL478) TaxID=1344416 RepID=A0A139A2Z1_GONPJ|nr:hypothetical protein M427DRAFT_61692 [Gonapodya prolifera JEL478]|eukprot:KXS10743.1 hypothetical protein M427DRAFT_61692 [Gonapodya prolifera JEL478]
MNAGTAGCSLPFVSACTPTPPTPTPAPSPAPAPTPPTPTLPVLNDAVCVVLVAAPVPLLRAPRLLADGIALCFAARVRSADDF